MDAQQADGAVDNRPGRPMGMFLMLFLGSIVFFWGPLAVALITGAWWLLLAAQLLAVAIMIGVLAQ